MSQILRGCLRITNGSNNFFTNLNFGISTVTKEELIIARRFSSSDIKPVTREEIDKIIKNKKLVVFMKGVPEEPRCGFSNAVVQILRMHGVSSYDSYDVLKDEGIRKGIKEYSNWPTIPQVYIDGEFIGGCDIVVEMHKNGELVEKLQKAGIKSILVEPHENEGDKKKD